MTTYTASLTNLTILLPPYTTSRTLPNCDIGLGSLTLPASEAGDFVELIVILQPLPSTSFPTAHIMILLPFHSTQSKLMMAMLNKPQIILQLKIRNQAFWPSSATAIKTVPPRINVLFRRAESS